MKPRAMFASMYGWCPSVTGLTRGEMELGLMANMKYVQANQNLETVKSLSCLFSSSTMADIAQVAEMPDREVIRLRVAALREQDKGI